ncbi:hypothetical protein NPIL_365651 [Nephila pilipes]|uniref:Uncharacterized protein n=1 Tax=Nephila pilipes TaxID=299642 RepID=A0A8X6QRX8_NEPPI|nr:hypothetical protein NPIL_365651 [Nephila pilipes]
MSDCGKKNSNQIGFKDIKHCGSAEKLYVSFIRSFTVEIPLHHLNIETTFKESESKGKRGKRVDLTIPSRKSANHTIGKILLQFHSLLFLKTLMTVPEDSDDVPVPQWPKDEQSSSFQKSGNLYPPHNDSSSDKSLPTYLFSVMNLITY